MLSFKIGKYHIYIIYTLIDKSNYYVRNGISTKPFIVSEINKKNFRGQILRDIDFSFSFEPNHFYLIHLVKVDSDKYKTIYEQRKQIIKEIETNNYLNVILSRKINYEDLFINENLNRFNIKEKILDKNIIYEILIRHLPYEIIKRICSYIEDTLEIEFVLHYGLTNPNHIYVSNPSINIPNFLYSKMLKV